MKKLTMIFVFIWFILVIGFLSPQEFKIYKGEKYEIELQRNIKPIKLIIKKDTVIIIKADKKNIWYKLQNHNDTSSIFNCTEKIFKLNSKKLK